MSLDRRSAMSSSDTGMEHSMTRCSTRPVSTMMTRISRVVLSDTSSTWRMLLRCSEGYCTSATWRVICASRRTVRDMTSSRSTASSRNWWMALRSGGLSGLTPDSRSTNSR